MNRLAQTVVEFQNSVPRVSGDEPGTYTVEEIEISCSPRKRG